MRVRYELRLAGAFGPVLRGALAGFSASSQGPHTVLKGRLSPARLGQALKVLRWERITIRDLPPDATGSPRADR